MAFFSIFSFGEVSKSRSQGSTQFYVGSHEAYWLAKQLHPLQTIQLLWGQKSLEVVLQILIVYKSLKARYAGGSPLRQFPLTGSPLMLSPLTRSTLRDHQ